MSDAGLQKIESINRKLAPALIFAAVSAWFFQTFIMGSDLFWHLSAGREICQTGSIPQTDPFSYTFGGKPWVNHEWLWDVVYWGVYQLGPDAVAWFTIGISVAIFSMCYLLAYRMSDSVFAAGVAVWLAAATSYWFLDIRPHTVTLLLVSVVLIFQDRKWAPWMWPPLIILWTNLHAGFFFGIGMIGLLVLVRTLEQSWEAKRIDIRWGEWLSVALCVVAWLVNPYGWRIAEFQLDYFFHESIYRNLVEWKSPEFTLDTSFYAGSFWWFSLLAIVGIILGRDYLISTVVFAITSVLMIKMKREDWRFPILIVTAVFLRRHKHRYLVALSCVAFILATKYRRFIPLFAIISTPFVALTLVQMRDVCVRYIPKLKSPWAGVGASLVALVCATTMWSQINLNSSLLRSWAMSDVYPEEAIQYLNAIGPDNGPPKRILNYYNWGGLIMLHAPGAKVFIDGRANTLYDEAIYKDYQQFLGGQLTPERLARYPADVALVPPNRFAKALENLQPPWRPIYRSSKAVILVPPGSPLLSADLPSAKDVLKNGIQPIVRPALVAADRGNNQQAAKALEKALEMQPYAVRVYRPLAQIYANMGSFDQISALIERGIRENPRRGYHLRNAEGLAYLKADQLERALDAFKLAISKGPFSSRESQLQRIKKIERELDRRKKGF